jgi:type VI secretion system protein ImpK
VTSSPAERTYHDNSLPLLYQGMLTAIVRIQSGRQPIVDADAFQKRMDSLLAEIGSEALRLGVLNENVEDANYAVLAFLDETIQRSQDPNRSHWTPMATRATAQRAAGDTFFERLNKIRGRPDSPEVADLLEVYCLCLLLGYEGPNSGARTPASDLLVRIHRIRGAWQDRLFPGGMKPTVQPAMERAGLPPPRQSGIWTWLASICLILACLSWAVLDLLQRAEARAVIREVTSR